MVHDDGVLGRFVGVKGCGAHHPTVQYIAVRGGELEEFLGGHTGLVELLCQGLVVYEGLHDLALHTLDGDDVGCAE